MSRLGFWSFRVVDTINTDDGATAIDVHLADVAHHFGQGLPQERRFVAMHGPEVIAT
jgi:hypothetical protein